LKRRVVALLASADELKRGDLIVTSRATVEEIMSTEPFKGSAGRPGVEVRMFDQSGKETIGIFAVDQLVLIVE
jgi:hypothetical protein